MKKFEELLEQEYEQLNEISKGNLFNISAVIAGFAAKYGLDAYLATSLFATFKVATISALLYPLGISIGVGGLVIAGSVLIGYNVGSFIREFASGKLRSLVKSIDKTLIKREKVLVKLQSDIDKNTDGSLTSEYLYAKVVIYTDELYEDIIDFLRELDSGITDDSGEFRDNLDIDHINKLVAFYKIILHEQKLKRFVTISDREEIKNLKVADIDWEHIKDKVPTPKINAKHLRLLK